MDVQVQGDKITKELVGFWERAKPGDRFIFTDIKVKCEDCSDTLEAIQADIRIQATIN